MPSRLLRESILDSEAVNLLSPRAEVFYRRLMSIVDDFGRFDGRTMVLRTRLFPLQLASITDAEIWEWLDECERHGLIRRYTVGAKPYLVMHKLGTPRAKKSHWPDPPSSASAQMKTDENGCNQTRADVPYSYSDSSSYSSARSDSDSCSHTRADALSAEQPTANGPAAELIQETLSARGITDPGYVRWSDRIAVLLGWSSSKQLSPVVEWYAGFQARKVTPDELNAAADAIAARSTPLKWPNEVLPAINAAIEKQRQKAATETRKATAGQPRDGPLMTPEQQKAMLKKLGEAKKKLGRE